MTEELQAASGMFRPEPDELRHALDQAAIVATTDQRGVITYVNDRFCALSQYSRDELIGQDHRLVNSSLHPPEFMRTLWRTIAKGGVWRGDIRNRAKDGSHYWVDTTIVPLLDERGKPKLYLSIRYDISARKQAEADLRERAGLAQLGELAAVVAHEVRNPLAGLRAGLQIIAGRVPEPRDVETIAIMIQRIDALNDKVSDLLQYARPQPVRKRLVELSSLLEEVAASAHAGARPSGLAIPVIGEPCYVMADPDMLRAVFLNLAVNACQASSAVDAPVDITVGEDAASCCVAVSDRGKGMTTALRERAFEPFFTTRANGTGLGLAVVRRLVDLHEGSVVLLDRPGGGTRAEVRLPRAAGGTASRSEVCPS